MERFNNRTFVINLDYRGDKLKFITSQLNKIDIDNFIRINAVRKNFDQIPKKLYSNFLEQGDMYIIGAYGAKESHLEAIRKAQSFDLGFALIVEDDIEFLYPKEEMNRLITDISKDLKTHDNKWEILFFSVKHPTKNQSINNNLNKCNYGGLSLAYLISKRGMNKVLKTAEENGKEYYRLLEGLNRTYSFNQNVVWNYPFFSDVYYDHIDYSYLKTTYLDCKKVSIIIPVYNKVKELDWMMETLRLQTTTPYEIIIVDDNSTEDVKSLAINYRKIMSCNILYFKATKQNNRSHNRNIGMNHATGDYILLLDADSLITKNYIKRMLEIHEYFGGDNLVLLGARYGLTIEEQKKGKDYAIKSASHQDMRWDRNVFKKCNCCSWDGKLTKVFDLDIKGYPEKISVFHTTWQMTVSNNLSFSQKQYERGGGMDENFLGWGEEDIDMAYRYYLSGARFCFIPHDDLFIYHIEHPVNEIERRKSLMINGKYLISKYPEMAYYRQVEYSGWKLGYFVPDKKGYDDILLRDTIKAKEVRQKIINGEWPDKNIEIAWRYDDSNNTLECNFDPDDHGNPIGIFKQPKTPIQNVSIVIPVHNKVYRELHWLLSSIVVQTALPREVIIVDDDSDQDVISKINEFKEMLNIIYLTPEKLHNRSHNRNIGMKKATGHYILLLDGDVMLTRNYIKRMMELHKRFNNTIIAGARYEFNYKDQENPKFAVQIASCSDNRWVGKEIIDCRDIDHHNYCRCCGRVEHPSPNLQFVPEDKQDCIIRHTAWNLMLTHNLSFPRKKIANRKLWFDEQYIGWSSEDIDFAYRCFKAGFGFYKSDQDLYTYHILHPDYTEERRISFEKNIKYKIQKFPEFAYLRAQVYAMWKLGRIEIDKPYIMNSKLDPY